ncbi:MAG: argininosuccinate lyase [Chloroflexota bacterium]|nr:argininosuccinate lyase [Chloroflexota bacterium]
MTTSTNSLTASLWGGRFSGEMDALMKKFQDSISFDIRMWSQDIRGSMAYARAINMAGIINDDEAATLQTGLQAIHDEFAAGKFEVKDGDEDIHTAVERRLKELVGDVGGKLHTGRSRNDQVATDTRFYCLEAIQVLKTNIQSVQSALVAQAEQHVSTLMPGYTHLQRGQPSTFGHWCMAYFWMLQRDMERLAECEARVAVLPLGSGALAGNPFAINRAALANDLGFREISQNSFDGVSDRDFVAELLFVGAMLGSHLSRLAEDLIIYATSEFGFVTFADAYSTGSSLMPQKKNPDAMELARGKVGRLTGNLVTLLMVMKGTPMTFNKDYQEDKEALFDTLDTLELLLPVCAGAIRTLRANADKMRAALDPSILSTDVAEYLVRKGVPFRDAHHASGRAVALAERNHTKINALTMADWKSISPHFDDDIADVFNFEQSVNSRDVTGGTSARSVREQIEKAQWLLVNGS